MMRRMVEKHMANSIISNMRKIITRSCPNFRNAKKDQMERLQLD